MEYRKSPPGDCWRNLCPTHLPAARFTLNAENREKFRRIRRLAPQIGSVRRAGSLSSSTAPPPRPRGARGHDGWQSLLQSTRPARRGIGRNTGGISASSAVRFRTLRTWVAILGKCLKTLPGAQTSGFACIAGACGSSFPGQEAGSTCANAPEPTRSTRNIRACPCCAATDTSETERLRNPEIYFRKIVLTKMKKRLTLQAASGSHAARGGVMGLKVARRRQHR